MNIVIIGLGQMGSLYVNKLHGMGISPACIFGIDIDPSKVEAMQGKIALNCDLSKMDAAIVATNTPSHHGVLTDLMDCGVKWIFCEKPLGIDMDAVDEVRDGMVRSGAQIYTAFLMNFSPALLFIIEKMEKEHLLLTEGSVVWGKNRFGDKRPTPGDLEDETVHGVGILHNLCAVNQQILQIDVVARLTYPAYANPQAQAKAHALDPSFPHHVNASTMALDLVLTDKCEVTCSLHSSFVHSQQTRRVTAVLSRADNPSQPVYSVEFNFDVKAQGGVILDQLLVTTLDGNIVEWFEFGCDKLLDQTRAFITAVSGGEVDPRLTGYNKAREAVAFSKAVIESHIRIGQLVTAYTEGDIVEMQQVI